MFSGCCNRISMTAFELNSIGFSLVLCLSSLSWSGQEVHFLLGKVVFNGRKTCLQERLQHCKLQYFLNKSGFHRWRENNTTRSNRVWLGGWSVRLGTAPVVCPPPTVNGQTTNYCLFDDGCWCSHSSRNHSVTLHSVPLQPSTNSWFLCNHVRNLVLPQDQRKNALSIGRSRHGGSVSSSCLSARLHQCP